MAYEKEKEFLKAHTDLLKTRNLDSLIAHCKDAGVNWPTFLKFCLALYEKTSDDVFNPLTYEEVLKANCLEGYHFEEDSLVIPDNVKFCEVHNVNCKSIRFENDETQVWFTDSAIDEIVVPNKYDFSDDADYNSIENMTGTIAIPNGTRTLSSNVISHSQKGLHISMSIETANNILIDRTLYDGGVFPETANTGWYLNADTVQIY